MKTYRSKIGLELLIPLSIVLIWIIITLINSRDWPGLAMVLLTTAFLSHLFFTIYYQVSNHTLVVKCSFLINTSIDIKSIKKIRESTCILAAAAASLDRLEIRYNDHDSILISPYDKEGFIDELLRINPDIEVIYKSIQ